MSHQNPPDATRVSRIYFYIIRTLRNLQDMELHRQKIEVEKANSKQNAYLCR